MSDDVIFFLGWRFLFSSIFTICDILFSIPVIHRNCIFIVLCCFRQIADVKLLTSPYFGNLWKNENFKFLDFALVTDGAIRLFDDIIAFKTCYQVTFITYRLKIKRIKFHEFSIKRTGFGVIFCRGPKSPPPAFEKLKKTAWDRVNVKYHFP